MRSSGNKLGLNSRRKTRSGYVNGSGNEQAPEISTSFKGAFDRFLYQESGLKRDTKILSSFIPSAVGDAASADQNSKIPASTASIDTALTMDTQISQIDLSVSTTANILCGVEAASQALEKITSSSDVMDHMFNITELDKDKSNTINQPKNRTILAHVTSPHHIPVTSQTNGRNLLSFSRSNYSSWGRQTKSAAAASSSSTEKRLQIKTEAGQSLLSHPDSNSVVTSSETCEMIVRRGGARNHSTLHCEEQDYSHESTPKSDDDSYSTDNPEISRSGKRKRSTTSCGSRFFTDSDDSYKSTTLRPESQTRSKKRRRRVKEGYKPPETYNHLGLLPDILEKNLICLFIGTNPGIKTAETGHAYSAPSNRFYPLLYSSNLTPGPRKLKPHEDRQLPKRFCLGNTNIVERPTRNQAELSLQEMSSGVPILEDKIRKYRPEAVCIVGKAVWERIYKWKVQHEFVKTNKRRGKGIYNGMRKELFKWGWQTDKWGDIRMGIESYEQYLERKKEKAKADPPEDEKVDSFSDEDEWYKGAKVFVAPSTSGLVTLPTEQHKREIFKELGDWVNERRNVRGFVVDPVKDVVTPN